MKMFMKLPLALFVLASLTPFVRAQYEGPPSLIDYQGRLLDSIGAPLASNENFEIRFRIWDAQTGGTLIWAEKQIVTVVDGLFSVRLGEGEVIATADGDPLPLVGSISNGPGALLGAFDGKERFLGVTVVDPPATPGEIQPRLAFLASPFSLAAEKAKFAEFGPSNGFFSADQIGIGTTSPTATLHTISSALNAFQAGSANDSAGVSFLSDSGAVQGAIGFAGTAGALSASALDGDMVLRGPGTGKLHLQTGTGTAAITIDAANNVGIGILAPTQKLHVAGNGLFAGNVYLGSDGYLDDDTTPGGNADDWMKFSGHLEMKSSTDNYGIVVRDKDVDANFLALTQIDGFSYFSDSASSSNYFLRGNGSSVRVPSLLEVGGTGDFGAAVAIGDVALGGGQRLHIESKGAGNSWDIILEDSSLANANIRQAGLRLSSSGFFEVSNSGVGGGGVSGNLARLDSGGNWTAVSDRRLKRDIERETGLLNAALKIQPVRYRYKSDSDVEKPKMLGFIAQNVEEQFPMLVSDDGGTMTLNYSGLSTVAIGAIQELKAEKDAEIRVRDEKITTLESRLARLEAAMATLIGGQDATPAE